MMARMARDERHSTAAQADFCRLLAACYYEPDGELAEEQVFEAMREAARAIDAELEQSAARLGAAFASEEVEDLLVEYTRLFLGPTNAPVKPYGSVWLGGAGALMQDSTVAVSRLYAEGGFELSEEFRDLPDHIAAELEFLYLLLFRREAARLEANLEEERAVTQLARRFLREHLGAWIGPFARRLKEASQSAFYRELAGLTERFVRMQAA